MPAVEELAGPTAFGKYTLLAKLAIGGMGEVFLARSTADAGFQKLLVIKRLLPHLTDNPQFVNMFLDEARLAAQLHHPNICQIYELGHVGSDHYMAMEYVEGLQLATLLRGRARSARLSDPRLTVALLSQACEALHHAHNLRMADGSLAGVVHRDVNPKNIMVTSAGTVKILDFGVVKARGKLGLSKTGTLKGTYSYMSPEQLRGEPLDRRSDIFSLGIIAWESVTGRRLFKRPTDLEVWRAIAEKPIPRASALSQDISKDLDDAIARALSKEREERFSTARELALALEESLGSYGAPLSTVAIAAEIERCFSNELEELRSMVLRVQRQDDDDEDDDDFDAPTRLFDNEGLKEQLRELDAVPTRRTRPVVTLPEDAISPDGGDFETTPEPVGAPENTPSAVPAAEAFDPAPGQDLGGDAPETEAEAAPEAEPDPRRPFTADPLPEPEAEPDRPGPFTVEAPTAPGKPLSGASTAFENIPTHPHRAQAPSGDGERAPESETSSPAAPADANPPVPAQRPPPEAFLPEEAVAQPTSRLPSILIAMIVALGLVVLSHFVWTHYLSDRGASSESVKTAQPDG